MKRRLTFGAALAAGVLMLSSGLTGATVSSGDRAMGGHDVSGNRDNSAGSTLNRTNVGGLAVKWTFNTPGAVYGTPAVVDGVVYDVDAQANVFALDAKTGGVKWATTVGPASLYMKAID